MAEPLCEPPADIPASPLRLSSHSLPIDWRYDPPSNEDSNLKYYKRNYRPAPVDGLAMAPRVQQMVTVERDANTRKAPYARVLSDHNMTSRYTNVDDFPHDHKESYLPLVRNHEDILRTDKDTLVHLAGCQHDLKPAYVVRFDLFAEYAELLLNAPLNQWLDCQFRHPIGSGQPKRQSVPLVVTLLHLREINDWLEHEHLFECFLIQVCDWKRRAEVIKEEEEEADVEYGWVRSQHESRVQRIRTFSSCDEAAANVFLDGYLYGISSLFGCLVLDSAKIDHGLYSTIRMHCTQQMLRYQDIVVREVGEKLFIF